MSNTKTNLLIGYELIAKLIAAVDGQKVDKQDGRGLSSNDFTTSLLNKLNGIEAGATGDQNASQVPTNAIPGVTGSNVQAMLESIKSLIDSVNGDIASTILEPIAAVTNLPANVQDKAMILVEEKGLYRFDSESTAAASGDNIIIPTGQSGAGRWVRMSTPLNDHNLTTNIQGGSSTERYHLTAAQVNKLNGIEAGAKTDQHAADVPTNSISGFSGTNVQTLLESIGAKVKSLDAIDHSHSNKSVLDTITSTLVSQWESANTVTNDLENNLTSSAIANTMDTYISAPYLQTIINQY